MNKPAIPLKVKGVSSSVVTYLKNQIISGSLKPGQKLNEIVLSEQLGVSRPPLREAFRVLESEHLVYTAPRKGAFVTDLSLKDLRDLYQVREMIECYAIELLKNVKKKKLLELEFALKKASSLEPPRDDLEKTMDYHKQFAEFHEALIRIADNARLAGFYDVISSNLTRYQLIYLYVPGSGIRSVAEHQRIFAKIKAGAYEEAKGLMKKHIYHTYNILSEKIRSK